MNTVSKLNYNYTVTPGSGFMEPGVADQHALKILSLILTFEGMSGSGLATRIDS